MKNFLTTSAIAILLMSSPAMVFAHGDEHHEDGEVHTEEVSLTQEQALQALEAGVIMMASTVSDEHRAEMFNDGPIMEKWHDKTVVIGDAIGAIRHHISKWDESKKARVNGSLNQLSKVLDDFHIATHERDAAKAQAEVTKAEGALKLIKAYMK